MGWPGRNPASTAPSDHAGAVAQAVRLDWSWPVGADVFRVTRGDYGSCVGAGLAAQSFDDDLVPPANVCHTYLVQPVSAACGAGSLGRGSNGAERVNLSPYACP